MYLVCCLYQIAHSKLLFGRWLWYLLRIRCNKMKMWPGVDTCFYINVENRNSVSNVRVDWWLHLRSRWAQRFSDVEDSRFFYTYFLELVSIKARGTWIQSCLGEVGVQTATSSLVWDGRAMYRVLHSSYAKLAASAEGDVFDFVSGWGARAKLKDTSEILITVELIRSVEHSSVGEAKGMECAERASLIFISNCATGDRRMCGID